LGYFKENALLKRACTKSSHPNHKKLLKIMKFYEGYPPQGPSGALNPKGMKREKNQQVL
jgi:hypothetical protein